MFEKIKKLSNKLKSTVSKAKLILIGGSLTVVSHADGVTIDLSDATSSITNAGTAIIGVVVVGLGLGLVISMIRRNS